jgi:hypothetical protein
MANGLLRKNLAAVGDFVHVEKFFVRNLGGLIHARTRVPGRLGNPTGHIVTKADCHCRASVISLTDGKTTLRYQTRVRHWLALSQMLFT